MICGFRNKRTRDFAAGRRVKAFEGIAERASMKLDQLEAAIAVIVDYH
jgi:plasmid maintenance system killer protein